MSKKKKRLSVDEIHAIIDERTSAEEQRQVAAAEQVFRRTMHKIHRGDFEVMQQGMIRVKFWGINPPLRDCTPQFVGLLKQAGFKGLKYYLTGKGYYQTGFTWEMRTMTEDWPYEDKTPPPPPPPPQPPSGSITW